MKEELVRMQIPARFRGPPRSGNGGYCAGLLAEALPANVEVTLRAPPPLDTPLALKPAADGGGELCHADALVAEARPVRLELEVPEPVSFEAARAAERDFIGLREHPYPECFVCGPARGPGDGLRLFPGPVPGRQLVAASWSAPVELCRDGALPLRYVWAALDCPSWFGYASFAANVPGVLLGRIAAQIERAPHPAEACVVVGWSLGREGRRIGCGAAIYDARGTCIARARSTWIAPKDARG